MWTLTMSSLGKWQLPAEGEEVILKIGSQFIIGYLVREDEDIYWHVEGCLDAMDYTLDDVYSWSSFVKPMECS